MSSCLLPPEPDLEPDQIPSSFRFEVQSDEWTQPANLVLGLPKPLLSFNRPGLLKQPLADVQMDLYVQEDLNRFYFGVVRRLVTPELIFGIERRAADRAGVGRSMPGLE